MLKIKVKAKEARFTILVPYAVFDLGISVISSRILHQQINKWVKKQNEHNNDKQISFTVPPIDKRELKLVMKELKKHKGLVLVDVKAQDGTEVLVRL